jgi:hypothetical protein
MQVWHKALCNATIFSHLLRIHTLINCKNTSERLCVWNLDADQTGREVYTEEKKQKEEEKIILNQRKTTI